MAPVARSLGGLRVAALAALLLALLPWLTACTDDDLDAVDPPVVLQDPSETGPAPQDDASASATRLQHSLVLEFSGSSTEDLLTNSGDRHFRVSHVSSADGQITSVTDAPDGQALRFPRYDPKGEDFSILRVRSRGLDDLLSPGRKSFVFGADVAMDDVTTGTASDNGDNLVQRGLYESSSQYKIQVDDGAVSCRVAGLLGEVLVYGPYRLQPDDWYRIRCHREGDRITLAVAPLSASGVGRWESQSETGRIGPVLMAADMPMSVGGKLSWSGELLPSSTDQFNGRVDRVYYHRD